MYYNVSTIIVFSHFALEIQTLCNDPGIKADDAAWVLLELSMLLFVSFHFSENNISYLICNSLYLDFIVVFRDRQSSKLIMSSSIQSLASQMTRITSQFELWGEQSGIWWVSSRVYGGGP